MNGTSNHNSPAIAIMAGGQSRRMGRDKAELEIDGQTLLDRMIDEAKRACEVVAVVGRRGERDDVVWIEDDEPGLGPLGGLKTALAHLDRSVLLVACDMPRIDAEALRWLLEGFQQNTGEHGLVTTRDGSIEPLFSVYTPVVLQLVEQRIAAGSLSVRRLIERGEFERTEAPGQVADKLVNVNTPVDLEQLN
jgi:molybdopterin-guanine dinucleotide biosynthesis protein A